MSVRMIQDRLDSYSCRSTLEEELALREITQENVLAALDRTDFFRHAALQGGTCLQIFHGLNRFSEDLGFAFHAPDAEFVLRPYLDALAKELTAYGYGLEIDDRSTADQTVRMAFLKDDSVGKLLQLAYRPATGPSWKLRIKLEVDTNPPAGASFETKYLDFPFTSAVRVFDPPSLFAGKIHALLCREYLKGQGTTNCWMRLCRSWVPGRGRNSPSTETGASRSSGPKIEATDWPQAREDVRRFLKPSEMPSLDLWGRGLFPGPDREADPRRC